MIHDNNIKKETPEPLPPTKSKEPYLGCFLSIILPGLGQYYAQRKKRALIILLIYLLFTALYYWVFYAPKLRITWLLVTISFVVFILFAVWYIVDACRCVKKWNLDNNLPVKPAKLKRTILVFTTIIFLFIPVLSPLFWSDILLQECALDTFHVPTGAMAPTLLGHHFSLPCSACGFEFTLGYSSFGEQFPPGLIQVTPPDIGGYSRNPICPMCLTPIDKNTLAQVQAGDQLIVNKLKYRFSEPQPWDLVVFKNPTDPQQNFIKRLIALPGETLEIIDGDIYIDGKIRQKNPRRSICPLAPHL